VLPENLDNWLKEKSCVKTTSAASFTQCDVCAITITSVNIIWYGMYTVCSNACLDKLKEKHKDHPFFAVRPARYQIGES
jgi:hypothetical protein